MKTDGEATGSVDLSWLRRPRSVIVVAQLLVSLPLVVITALLLAWLDRVWGWPQWILPVAWLIWCVIARYRPVRFRFVTRMRAPTADEAALLTPAWESVARAAGVPSAKYPLMVQDKPLQTGLTVRPRAMLVVNVAALTEPAPRTLSALNAHGLGLQLIGPSYAQRLTSLYRRPAIFVLGIAGAAVSLVVIATLAAYGAARGLTDSKGSMSGPVRTGVELLGYLAIAGMVLPVFGVPGAVTAALVCVLDSYGKEFLGLYRAVVADRVALCLGYGWELYDYLAAHPDQDRFRRSLPWTRGRLWYLERRMSADRTEET
ncbi:hypothetical protein ABZ942_15850 [Nocardia sp. NPDC046473]|uniref:hypothetical protein n=1 Tax=Nocardia sp. NPDC046473 TaxID=3155733 RepID=UPI0033DDC459